MDMPSINKQLVRQVILYGLVGGLTLLIDLTVTTVLYSVFHLRAFEAIGIGFLSGFMFNFPMNRKNVFRHQKNDRFSLKWQIVMYGLLCIFNLFATSTITQILVSHSLKIAYAKLVVTALIAGWNFLIFKLLIFSKLKPTIGAAIDERLFGDIF